MLIRTKEIENKHTPRPNTGEIVSFQEEQQNNCFIGRPDEILKKHIGALIPDKNTHFVTLGRWSMHDLIFYCLKQTGPAHLLIATWSISEISIRNLVKKFNEKEILSVKFLLDPRVKVRNPKPLQMLQANFEYTFSPCHAKVTTIENQNWNLSIIASANLTNNPRIERGVICPGKDVFDFDKKWITNAINRRSNTGN
jgi:hypothetical protein